MKKWLLVFALLLLPVVGLAQPAPQVKWEHDGANVTTFKCQIDSGTIYDLGLLTPSGQTYTTALSNCGTLSAGQHLLYVFACNGTTCTPATAIMVVKL